MSVAAVRQDATVPVGLSVDFALGFPRPGLDLVVIGAGDHRLSAVKNQVQGLVDPHIFDQDEGQQRKCNKRNRIT